MGAGAEIGTAGGEKRGPRARRGVRRLLMRAVAGAGVLLLVLGLCCMARLRTRGLSEQEAITRLRPVMRLLAKEGHHPVRTWLRRHIRRRDPHWLALPVTRIELVGARDEHLDCLRALRELRTLTLSEPRISEGGFARLGHLRLLESLTLTGETVTDAALRDVGALPRLERLDLHATAVTDAGLSHLAKFAKLEVVNLEGTEVTAEGIAALREMRPGIRITERK